MDKNENHNNHDPKDSPESKTNSSNKKDDEIQNFEDILDRMGGFGPFQVFILTALLFFEIPIAFTQFLQVFVGTAPQVYTCGNETLSIAGVGKLEVCECNETLTLDELTIVGEWSLICDQAWVSDFLTTIQMGGMFFGNVLGSVLADWYGRRSSFLASLSLGAIGQMLSATSVNPYMYAVSRFLCGFSFAWYMGGTSIYSIEFLPTKWRHLSGSLGPFAEGTMLFGLLGYLFPDWRTLTWVTIAPFFVLIFVFPFVPESPRWLMQQKKLKEMDKVLRYIAKVNKTEPIKYEVLERILKSEADTPQPRRDEEAPQIPSLVTNANEKAPAVTFDKVKKASYLDLFREPGLRRTTICLMSIWGAWAMSYFGVTYNVKNMDGSRYLNMFWLGLADRLGYTSAFFLSNKFGRCHLLLAAMSFSALCYVILAVMFLAVPHAVSAAVLGSLCMLGKFGLASARSATRTLTGESYPTNVRTMGIGMSGVTASLGAALSPQIAFLGTYWPSLPYFAFAAITIVGSLFSFLMTETKGKPMQEGTTSKIKSIREAVRRVSVTSIISSISTSKNAAAARTKDGRK